MTERNIRNNRTDIIVMTGVMAAVLVPVLTLFGKGTYLYYMLTAGESLFMIGETAAVSALLAASLFLIGDRRKSLLTAAAIVTLFCYIHVCLLPMLLTGAYLILILILGRKSFVKGSAILITGSCVLSALGAGSINNIRIMTAALFAFGISMLFIKKEKPLPYPDIPWDRTHKIMLLVLLTGFVIQAGRINTALDFDSLWYGLRSEYVLDMGKGIYEDPGLVGMVYVYSKGLEILMLPFGGMGSYGFITFFNIWLLMLGALKTYSVIRKLGCGERAAAAGVIITGVIPAIMNMGLSAKPDVITWVLQLIMLDEYFGGNLGYAIGAFLLSLAMKPTAVIFSTALMGMMVIDTLIKKKKPVMRMSIFPAAALAGVWARTFIITGLPFTSVFSSVLTALGFKLKYPFAASSIPQNYQERPVIAVLGERAYRILLSPAGKDMSHVIIAWGGPIAAVLLLVIIIGIIKHGGKPEKSRRVSMLLIFLPFLGVNLTALSMLYQVDGNYFMTLISLLIISACVLYFDNEEGKLKLFIPVLILQLLLCMITNWASVPGYSKPDLLNRGWFDHHEENRLETERMGSGKIWNELSADSRYKVISFGDHPETLVFPCITESYSDITAPWGNVDLVWSPEAFEKYMKHMGTDFIFLQKGHEEEEAYEWRLELLGALEEKGVIESCIEDEGGTLFRVMEK